MTHLKILLCAVFLFSSINGYAQEIWQTPEGKRCVEQWINDTTTRLNRYNGSADFNKSKPWSINKYGHFMWRYSRQNYEPDAWWGTFRGDKYNYMWGALYQSEQQFPNWKNTNFNNAGISGMRYFVRRCVRAAPVSNVPARTVPDSNLRCNQYARNATAQQQENLRLNCGSTGARWQSNFNNHYNWCVRYPSSSANRETQARQRSLNDCRRGQTRVSSGTSGASLIVEWLGINRDEVGKASNATPNGEFDGQFRLLIRLPINNQRKVVSVITLQSVNAAGKLYGGQGWDTNPGGYWILGVVRDGRRLNSTDRKLSDLVQGSAQYYIYGNDSGWFKVGNYFRVTVTFNDGTNAVSVIKLSGVPTSTGTTRTGFDIGKRCNNYARNAIAQHQENLRLNCGSIGLRWQSNYNNHYNWCKRASSSSANSETQVRERTLNSCRRR